MLVAALSVICVVPNAVRAQQGPPIPDASGTQYTLHVYEDLLQFAALVLTPEPGGGQGLSAKDFTLHLDEGPAFHPRRARVEGKDPITLALLLDASGSAFHDPSPPTPYEVARLQDGVFTPDDHIAVYGFDCNLVGKFEFAQASGSVLQAGVSGVLASSNLHTSVKQNAGCEQNFHLWDAVAFTASKIAKLPGRKAIIVVSTGMDTGSTNSWEMVRRYVAGFGISVFGLRIPSIAWLGIPRPVRGKAEDPFQILCDGTGGLLMDSRPDSLSEGIQRVVALLRTRYILDVPRPANESRGLHQLEATVPKRTSIVHLSGVSMPLKDKGLDLDPTTVPTKHDDAPVMGNRKPLTPN